MRGLALPAAPLHVVPRGIRLPVVVLGLLVVAYGLGFGWLTVERHAALRTNAEDLGFTDQVIWNFLRGQAFRFSLYEKAEYETDVDLAALKRPDSFLAFHVEPMTALLAPLYLALPDVRVLLWLQAIGVALGAIPAYRLARRRLGSAWIGLAFAATYLLAPLGQWALFSDFHTVALAAPLLMLAVDALDEGRRGLFLVSGLLAVSTKEEIGLVFAGLGLLALLRPEARWVGLLAVTIGAGWSLLCVGVIIPAYSGGAVSPFTARYAHLGAGPAAALATLVQNPSAYLEAFSRPEVLGYIGTLILAGGWLALFAPELLAPAGLVLALNVLSNSPWMSSGRAHYSASVLPFLVAASVVGTARIARLASAGWQPVGWWKLGPWSPLGPGAARFGGGTRQRHRIAAGLVAVLVVFGGAFGYRQAGAGPLADGFVVPQRLPRHEVAARLAGTIPPDVPVSASTTLFPHLSQRASIYLFPTLRDADYVFVDVAGSAFPISPGGMYRRVQELLGGGQFRLVEADDGIALLKREASATQPLPDRFFEFARVAGPPSDTSQATFLDGALRLVRSDLVPTGDIGPRGPLATLETVWTLDRTIGARPRPSIEVTLRDGSRQLFYDLPTVWWYPPEKWRPGELVRLDVPALPLREVAHWETRVAVEEPPRAVSPPTELHRHDPPAPSAEASPLSSTPDAEEVRLGELTARIERDPWRLTLLDPNGQPFWREVDPAVAEGLLGPFSYRDAAGDRWRLTRLIEIEQMPGSARLLVETDEPNGRTVRLELHSLSSRAARISFTLSDPSWIAAVGQAVEAAADERFVGFGERYGSLDQRGKLLHTWAQDRRDVGFGDATYAPIPFFLSSRGYSLLLESDARGRFDVAATHPERLAWEIDRPSASLVVTYGPSPRELVQQNAALTGLPPLPPIWAFGVWKTAVGGEQQVLRDAARLRERRVAASALLVYDAADDQAYLGWPFVGFAGRRSGPYPDLRRLTDRLHATGFKVLAYKNPDLHVRRTTRPTPETARYLVRDPSGGVYVHPHHEVSWVDFTNPETVAWWGQTWRRALVDLGFDGGMLDLGELVPEDARYADGSDGISTHNRYLGLYAQASFEAARAARGDDFAIFARSGSLGAQRYQSLQWSGDQLITWDVDGIGGLVPAGLSMGISGFPYWHPEVGGFLGVGLPRPSERELWFRWLQLGALSPLMRDQYGEHLGEPVELWSDADTIAAFKTYADLHNSLVPYLYSHARIASETGLPIMRALALAAPEDPRAWAEEHSYTLGDDLLVAPVVEQGARLRTLYVPPGRWIDWWTGQAWEGGSTITVDAPLDRIPLFVRDGAILPLATPFDTLVPSADPSISTWTGELEVRVAAAIPLDNRPLPAARFRLYDGTVLETKPEGQSLTLEARSAPSERGYQLRLPSPMPPTGVFVDGAPVEGWAYDNQTVRLSLRAAGFSVMVQW